MRTLTTKVIETFNTLKKAAVFDSKSPVMDIVYLSPDKRRIVLSGRISNLKNISEVLKKD